MKIEEINLLIQAEIEKGCVACNNCGVYHCAHPEECGQWDELGRLEKEKKRIISEGENKY